MNGTPTRSGVKHLIKSLSSVNWNFPGSTTQPTSVHSLHRFPGNFIPQLPSYLIQILSSKGDIVLDPFCGSGTTGVEAVLLGRNSIQSDINLASINVARGKLAMLTSPKIDVVLHSLLDTLIETQLRGHSAQQSHQLPTELNDWYEADTLNQLRIIWGLIKSTRDPGSAEVLEMLFTDTLFACASTVGSITAGGKSRRHHWGWIADNVKPKPAVWHDAFKIFRDRLIHAYEVAVATKTQIAEASVEVAKRSTVRRDDARALFLEDKSVDLVVTSPPYLAMIDYTLANRLTYLWYGWSQFEDKQLEIGARYRRSRKDVVEDYVISMRYATDEIARVLRPNSFCAIVIGASRKFPEASQAVIELFEEKLDLFWGPLPRMPSRRRVSERSGSEFSEMLCVFRKSA